MGDTKMNTASILGVQFHAVTKQQAVELAMSKIRSRQKGYVVTPNPEIVDLCRHDEKFMGVVNHATLVLPDGIGIIYAAKILGEKLQGKVAGIEFAESLVAAMAKENMRLYLLGAKPGRKISFFGKSHHFNQPFGVATYFTPRMAG
jgi:N-acetylglucosaminyldiphosphoundecaprenol N-acetyl-beta-D-mannosaminyltransferase